MPEFDFDEGFKNLDAALTPDMTAGPDAATRWPRSRSGSVRPPVSPSVPATGSAGKAPASPE